MDMTPQNRDIPQSSRYADIGRAIVGTLALIALAAAIVWAWWTYLQIGYGVGL